jgi:hypothetical protein
VGGGAEDSAGQLTTQYLTGTMVQLKTSIADLDLEAGEKKRINECDNCCN